jgi:hypothetical protein
MTTRGEWMEASNFFRNVRPLSQNQTSKANARKNNKNMSQRKARYLRWWLRDTAEQSETTKNEHTKEREKTVKNVHSRTVRTSTADCLHSEPRTVSHHPRIVRRQEIQKTTEENCFWSELARDWRTVRDLRNEQKRRDSGSAAARRRALKKTRAEGLHSTAQRTTPAWVCSRTAAGARLEPHGSCAWSDTATSEGEEWSWAYGKRCSTERAQHLDADAGSAAAGSRYSQNKSARRCTHHDASTSSSQAPSRTYNRKLTKNSKERTGYRANKNQREFDQSSIIRSQNLSRLNSAKPEPFPRDHCLGLTQTPGNKEIETRTGLHQKAKLELISELVANWIKPTWV